MRPNGNSCHLEQIKEFQPSANDFQIQVHVLQKNTVQLAQLVKEYHDTDPRIASRSDPNITFIGKEYNPFEKVLNSVSASPLYENWMRLVREKPEFCCTEPLLKKIAILISSVEGIRLEMVNRTSNFTSRFDVILCIDLFMEVLSTFNQYHALLQELNKQLENHGVTQSVGEPKPHTTCCAVM